MVIGLWMDEWMMYIYIASENVSSNRKCCLVPVSGFNSAEPLDATGGSLILRNPS